VVTRLLAPFLLKYFTNKIQDKFQQQFNQQFRTQERKDQEGKVTIEKQNTSRDKTSDDLGEYVDFEELDE
tara:strand:- start:2742 stop:2951 length:210 start_codon:yes stop_codon:yes gene_type:complete